jgi:hypothetical protein
MKVGRKGVLDPGAIDTAGSLRAIRRSIQPGAAQAGRGAGPGGDRVLRCGDRRRRTCPQIGEFDSVAPPSLTAVGGQDVQHKPVRIKHGSGRALPPDPDGTQPTAQTTVGDDHAAPARRLGLHRELRAASVRPSVRRFLASLVSRMHPRAHDTITVSHNRGRAAPRLSLPRMHTLSPHTIPDFTLARCATVALAAHSESPLVYSLIEPPAAPHS